MNNGYHAHPDFAQPVTYDAVALPLSGDDAVAATVAMMKRYAINDSRSPYIVQQMNSIASSVGSGDEFVAGVFDAAQSRMYFQRDELTGSHFSDNAVEVLVRPVDVMLMSDPTSGVKVPADCDCHSMYVASLLVAAGIPCAFVTVAASSNDPRAFSHVYVVAWPGSEQRTVIDASHGKHAGWEAPNKGRYQEWPVVGPEVGAGSAICTLAFLAIVAGVWWFSSRERGGFSLSDLVPEFDMGMLGGD